MSKRAEKKKRAEERRKEKRKQLLVGGIITIVFALTMMILGILGYVNNRSEYTEYKDSEDVRTVEGKITRVDVHSREDEYGKEYYYYKVAVSFRVDNTDYEDETELKKRPNIGDTVTVEVYKTKEGEYRIPETSDDASYRIDSFVYLGVAIFGFVLLVIAIIVLLPEKKTAKNQSKE